MAINIQEILHPSDSDSIKFGKINYNFDQILANGGGPIGPKGQKGNQGQVGSTGSKGEKGDIGVTGSKGDSGATDSPWYKVQIDANGDGNNEISILKPKRGSDLNLPIVWLGDSTFTEDVENGEIGTNARLTIAKDATFENYSKFLHDENHSLVLTSDTSGAFTRFAFKNDFGSSNIEFAAMTNKISLTATSSELYLQGVGVGLKTTGSNNITLQTAGTGFLDVDLDAAFKGYLRLPYGGTGQRPTTPQVGMIRFNSDLDVAEAYYNNSGSPEWRELCTDCGSGVADSIGIIGGDIDANIDGSPAGSTISISGGDIDANLDGSPTGGSPSPTATPTPSATPSSGSGSGSGSGVVAPTATPVPNPTATPDSGGGAGSGSGGGSGSTPILSIDSVTIDPNDVDIVLVTYSSSNIGTCNGITVQFSDSPTGSGGWAQNSGACSLTTRSISIPQSTYCGDTYYFRVVQYDSTHGTITSSTVSNTFPACSSGGGGGYQTKN